MDELLSDLYETSRDTERVFGLRGNVVVVGTISDILDHGIVVLTGRWVRANDPITVMVPVAHINYISERGD
jgi:hypothetical protein